MATINSEYYRFNGTEWDKYYFKTTMAMVDGLTAALNSKLSTSGGTINGSLEVNTLDSSGPIYGLWFEGPIAYVSNPPTAVLSYGLGFYVNSYDPPTKYAGWVYIIV